MLVGDRRANKRSMVRLVCRLLVLLAAGTLLSYFAAESLPGMRARREAPVPAALADQITVFGLPNARFWAWIDTEGAALAHEWEQSLERERALAGLDGRLPPA